jgi:hypothetical protein
MPDSSEIDIGERNPMFTALEAMLVLIEGLMGELGTGATVGIIDKVLAALTTVIPVIAAQFPNLLASVQNIIDSLEGTGNVTQAQQVALDAISAQVDAAFSAAAAAAGDPDPAPVAPSATS